ncbi:Phosphopantetheine attachment site, partial [Streptomyces sp. yr375]|uniref:type I polyketide synthase n=1 Tax=Streptomyces sp. yr375 TaxID=1761906 RepID=UPI0008CD96CA
GSAVDVVEGRVRERGWRCSRLRVSHAFHSPLVEPVLERFREAIAGVAFAAPRIPFVSTVEVGATPTTADYWVRNVRETVRFADAVAHLHAQGVTRFVEVGPDTALTAAGPDCLPEDDATAVFVPLMRRDQPEVRTLAAGLARFQVHGGAVDWARYLPAADPVDLPTYAFEHRRYWLDNVEPAQRGGYPLLDATVEFAEEDGFLLSGRLATRAQPWLREHTVLGATVVPGSVFVELALHAAAEAGAGEVAELTLQAPLVLPEHGAVELQLRVGAPGAAGDRPLTVHARPAGDGTAWTCYARAVLGTVVAAPQADLDVWPPRDAVALDVGTAYAEFAATGLQYGPAFQGLRAAWRRGDEIFADIALPELTDTARYGLHPALLDAALHAMRYLREDEGGGEDDRTLLPFAWSGIALRRTGASALRVRISAVAAEAARIELADATGAPVGVVESLAVRPISAQQLGHHESLYVEDLVPATLPAVPGPSVLTCADLAELPDRELPSVVVLSAATEADPVASAGWALGAVRTWLAEDRFADTRLALRTRNARTDPAAAAVWGLLRSVQQEHPNRFLLADVEGVEGVEGTDSAEIPATAWNIPGGQLVLRDGELLVPRLSPVPLSRITDRDGTAWDPYGPVLITGGLGALGAALARHLAADCGVRELVLTGRRGADTPGAAELAAELAELGATARIVACDMAEREAVAALLAEHPVTAVVHAAGVVDDGLVTGLTEERLRAVLAPKVLGARWLDELTRDRELTDFVLFSSAAGVLGAAGQSAYAAANAALDALARARHAAGLPATSLAWGLWEQRSGITGGLAEADLARIARAGLRPLATAEALELFDLARAVDEPVLAPLRLDRAAIGAGGPVPAVLRGLVRETPAPAAVASAGPTTALAALSGSDRAEALLTLVRAEAAGVLAYDSPTAVAGHRTFAELGVDSLAAVELRNRLSEATGIRLPAAVVFEYATPVALAAHLHESMPAADGTRATSVLAELDQLETALTSAEPGAVDRAKLRMRLTALLAKYGGEDQTGSAPEPDLSSASDDELFDLVDDLGAS